MQDRINRLDALRRRYLALSAADRAALASAHADRVAEAAKAAESKAREWLVVLARCSQLQDAIAVLELDRVLETAPEDLDGHRLGLKAARGDRLATISRSTEQLMARLDAAASLANTKVLAHPSKARAVVHSRNYVGTAVVDFQGLLGIESGRQSVEARRWVDAATAVRDRALDAGAERVDGAKRLGNQTRDRARSTTSRLAGEISLRTPRRRRADRDVDDDTDR